MDIEFMVQDIFALTRPQWRLAANLEDAVATLQSALSDQQKMLATDRITEIEERSSTYDSEDDNADGDIYSSSSEEEDLEVGYDALPSPQPSGYFR